MSASRNHRNRRNCHRNCAATAMSASRNHRNRRNCQERFPEAAQQQRKAREKAAERQKAADTALAALRLQLERHVATLAEIRKVRARVT